MKKVIRFFLTVFLVCFTTFSSFASEMYVYDQAGLLTAEERAELDAQAAQVAEKYNCGVYMVTMDDYRKYSTSDVFTTATEIYHGLELGKGEGREGILLMLSMYERDYATFFYGDRVEYAFDEYGQIELEEEFLDDFGDNDWYDGFEDYVSVCDDFLGRAAAGDPVRESPAPMILIVVVISLVVAFLITFGLRMTMISVKKGTSAAVYATADGLNLTRKSDFFLYKRQTRQRIQSSSSSRSGSGSRSGGGGSGRSGKF